MKSHSATKESVAMEVKSIKDKSNFESIRNFKILKILIISVTLKGLIVLGVLKVLKVATRVLIVRWGFNINECKIIKLTTNILYKI